MCVCDAASNPLAQAHTAQHSTTKTTTTKTDKALAAALPPLPPPSPPYAGTVGGGAPLLLATLLLCLDSRQSLNAPLFVFLLLLLFLACIYFCILYLLQLVQPLCFGPQSTPVKYADESYTHTSIIYKGCYSLHSVGHTSHCTFTLSMLCFCFCFAQYSFNFLTIYYPLTFHLFRTFRCERFNVCTATATSLLVEFAKRI